MKIQQMQTPHQILSEFYHPTVHNLIGLLNFFCKKTRELLSCTLVLYLFRTEKYYARFSRYILDNRKFYKYFCNDLGTHTIRCYIWFHDDHTTLFTHTHPHIPSHQTMYTHDVHVHTSHIYLLCESSLAWSGRQIRTWHHCCFLFPENWKKELDSSEIFFVTRSHTHKIIILKLEFSRRMAH